MKKGKEKFNTVKVEDAVGKVLMHDITRIVPASFKGPAFKKGDIIKESDIPLLRDLGKEHIYAFKIPEGFYHEDRAAELFKGLAGKNIYSEGPSEGKIVFKSKIRGMAYVNRKAVRKINYSGSIALTTIHSHISVKKDDIIAGIRALPLVVEKKKVEEALSTASGGAVIDVFGFKKREAALIVTGEEIASGRIKDGFRPLIEKKLNSYDSGVNFFSTPGDSPEKIAQKIREAAGKSSLIILTGGMSVDPDDKTSLGIKKAGVEIVSSGAPVLPGNMLLVGYLKEIPVVGIPACALYSKITALDLFLPYLFAGIKIRREDIREKGYGGLCRNCSQCFFPSCAFGK